ncbi:MAG TPA: DmsE family decaheme c-type cytochrome [Terriglobia bacterium]|nr:DmsE family decaheme c-type cytochrome [Terriglobia bacterium]
MDSKNKLGWIFAMLALGIAVHLPGGVPAAAAASKTTPGAGLQDFKGNPADYVGQDTCKACHEDMYNNWAKSPHWKTTLSNKGPEWQGCEACHGPGKAHAEAMAEAAGDPDKIAAAKKLIFNFKGVPTQDISKRCLSCHVYDEEHSNFARQAHNINNVSCIDCHSPHHAKTAEYLLAEPQPKLCFSCHNEVKADFSKPFHHRVNEGLVKCTDCHNQHGGFLTAQLRSTAAQDQVCFKCHTDKAGPFVYEHAPVKTDGCVVCHTPHGSSNPRLLKRSQVNLLCLECHTFTVDSGAPGIPSFHNQTAKYQACTLCHPMIHGSNFNAFFFR